MTKGRNAGGDALTPSKSSSDLSRRGFTLSLPNGESFTEDVPWVVAHKLIGGEVGRLATPIHVHKVRLLNDGFSITVDGDKPGMWTTVLFTPLWFSDYQKAVAKAYSPEEIENLNSIEASNLLCVFFLNDNERVGRLAELGVQAGLFSFQDVRRDLPEAFKAPSFQRFFAESYVKDDLLLSRKKKGSKFDPGVVELYALATSFVVETPQISWDKACEQAVEQCPGLVPGGWKSDHVANLKRETTRKLDHSKWSLSGWRKIQDK